MIGHLQLQRPQLSLSSAVDQAQCGGSDSDSDPEFVGNGAAAAAGGGGGGGGGGGERASMLVSRSLLSGTRWGWAGAGPSVIYIMWCAGWVWGECGQRAHAKSDGD